MGLLQQSYDRICLLKLYGTIQGPSTPNGPTLTKLPVAFTFSSKQPDGSSGYRIKFDVNKVSGENPTPHLGVIEIYNLSADSRALFIFNAHVVLQAGYGTNAQTLFEGNISYTRTKKVGPDYVTEIHAGDGLFGFQNSLINVSLSQRTTAAQGITTLIGSLSGAGIKPGLISTIPTAIYNKGLVFSGKVIDELKTFCSANDINFTIENNAVNVVKYGEPLLKPFILLSEETGLIGIPEQRAIDINSASLISFKCLLNPQISIFQLILMKSKFVNGEYITASVHHYGDTWGNDWYTDCEAT